MAQIWNGYKRRSTTIGGGLPVWVEIPKDVIGGAYLLNKLKDFEVLSSGSPVEYDYKTHTAKILKCFEVTNVEVSGTDTIISVSRDAVSPILYVGTNVMVAPTSITETGKAVTITSVDESEANVSKIKVSTDDIDAVVIGGFLVESDKAGTGAKLYAVPNNLTKDDTVGGDQNTVGIPRGEKYVYENAIPAMPDVIKNNIVDLAHVEFAWFPEV